MPRLHSAFREHVLQLALAQSEEKSRIIPTVLLKCGHVCLGAARGHHLGKGGLMVSDGGRWVERHDARRRRSQCPDLGGPGEVFLEVRSLTYPFTAGVLIWLAVSPTSKEERVLPGTSYGYRNYKISKQIYVLACLLGYYIRYCAPKLTA